MIGILQKAEKNGRTKANVDAIICWLTGYNQQTLQHPIDHKTDFKPFFARAPQLNPKVSKITGVICGYRVEEIQDKLMQTIHYLDKLVNELAKGNGENFTPVRTTARSCQQLEKVPLCEAFH